MLLKPQDALLALKFAADPAGNTYAELAKSLGLSVSETHAAVKRAQRCRLLTRESHPSLVLRNLQTLLVHALPLLLPLEKGAPAKGMPTSYAAEPFTNQLLMESSSMPLVWPDAASDVLGTAVTPLYPSVPFAAKADPKLYEWLALTDSLRGQEPRARELAMVELESRLRKLHTR